MSSFKKNDLCVDQFNNIVLVIEDEIDLYYDNEVNNDYRYEFIEVFVLGISRLVCIYDLWKIEEGDFL